MFEPGDYVYPIDLPRRFLCRVTETITRHAENDAFQILRLRPLERVPPEN